MAKKRISIKRMLANVLCFFHCLIHFHRIAIHGEGRMFCGFLVWDEVDIIWCEDCGRIYYDESRRIERETTK